MAKVQHTITIQNSLGNGLQRLRKAMRLCTLPVPSVKQGGVVYIHVVCVQKELVVDLRLQGKKAQPGFDKQPMLDFFM